MINDFIGAFEQSSGFSVDSSDLSSSSIPHSNKLEYFICLCTIGICYVILTTVALIFFIKDRRIVRDFKKSKGLTSYEDLNYSYDDDNADSSKPEQKPATVSTTEHAEWMSWFCTLFLCAGFLRVLLTLTYAYNVARKSSKISNLLFGFVHLISPQPEYASCSIVAGTWIDFVRAANALHKGKYLPSNEGNGSTINIMIIVSSICITFSMILCAIAGIISVFDFGVGFGFLAFANMILPAQHLAIAALFLGCTIALIVTTRKVFKGVSITSAMAGVIAVTSFVCVTFLLRAISDIVSPIETRASKVLLAVIFSFVTDLLPLCLILFLYAKRTAGRQEDGAADNASVSYLPAVADK